MSVPVIRQITRLGPLVVAISIATTASSASAAPYIPPGNSAATQYTEAVPTAGGPKATGKAKQGKGSTPGAVLGARNVAKLAAHGPTGHAAAALATETAPAPVAAAAPPEPSPDHEIARAHIRPSEGDAGREGGNADSAGTTAQNPPPAPTQAHASAPSGSSGLGEVLGAAAGSSSSNRLGILLPLLILGTAAWAIGYLLGQRRKRPVA